MNQIPGNNDEGSKTRNPNQIPPQAGPYGPPGTVLPANQPPTAPQFSYPGLQAGGGSTYPQPALPPQVLPPAFPPGYRQQAPAYMPNPAAPLNANLAGQGAAPAQRLVIVLLIVGIIIAAAYLGFLLLVLVKPDILALPASLSGPVSITTLAQQLGNITQVGGEQVLR